MCCSFLIIAFVLICGGTQTGQHEQKRKIMGENGRKFIEENFSWNTIAKEFLKILEKNGIK